MTRILGATCLAAFFCLSVLAEHAINNGEAHGIGIGGTVHRTWGFNYRRYFDSNFGISANLGGWLSHNYGHIGTAVGGSYTLAHHKFVNSGLPQSSIRVYGIAYLAGIYEAGRDYANYEARSKDRPERTHAFDVGLGVGPGAEFFFTHNFALHLELPWMTFLTIKNSSVSFARSYPNFGGGISYYF